MIVFLFVPPIAIQVQQRLAGCQLHNNGTPGVFKTFDAFNGEDNGWLHFSVQQEEVQFEGIWSSPFDHIERIQLQWMHTNIYSPMCIKTLKNNLHARQNDVRRRVKPRVRLLRQRIPDSGGVRVTCLATGFYPRHINLTLLRDGQPVPDHQITGGELLPNGDETYQMRKSLEVSTEELQQHHYTCTAQHLSLDNKLDFGLGTCMSVDKNVQE
ncbi:antigen-presenting glycoprotein CD1d-like [Engraulis encrasicolus]|uniref:antigen-presenting glycoprotein CD1d-like n=1 Tax=Engraulis encrasicolus TaxID=184585 RepID=UPI002FD2A51E